MLTRSRAALIVVVIATVAACATPAAKAPTPEPAVTVEKHTAPQSSRLTLSARAVDRLGIQTEAISSATPGAIAVGVIPYAAILYDSAGRAWAYTNPSPRVFVRAALEVTSIERDHAFLSAGPAPGTLVVTVGAPELYGVETGVGGGH